MNGIVAIVGRQSGLAALETTDGDYTVFTILDGIDLELEDVITGDLRRLGREVWINETQRRRFSVFVEDIDASHENALRMVRRG